MADHASLVAVLRARADSTPDAVSYTFLSDGSATAQDWTYGDLDTRARAIASRLQASGLAGERALLLYPPGIEYLAAFFGCLYAGTVAVPAYPPASDRPRRALGRLEAMMRDCTPRAVLTTSEVASAAMALDESTAAPRPTWCFTDQWDNRTASIWRPPQLASDALAFLQYTSGSTGTPRGVMLTHGNLLHNQRMLERGFRHGADSLVVGWLPLFHDMGLIGNVLHSLYSGVRCVLMSPKSFLQRPIDWLRAISRYGATTSGGPNFAYELCVRRTTAEERAGLDLSRWHAAFVGAEPIRAETLNRFAEAFAPSGFRPTAFYACYGLAEATLIVSGGLEPRVPVVSPAPSTPNRLDEGGECASVQSVVGCGSALLDEALLIVDPASMEVLGDKTVGEVWVAGPHVARGYWNNPYATAQTFGARLPGHAGTFLRTGDLGFIDRNELHITGRLKDLIIIRGRNIYPHDVEATVERSHPALRVGSGAAFSIDVANEEQLVVVQGVESRRREDLDAAVAAIRASVAEEHDVQVYAVALVRPSRIPKTSSGKIQRQTCRGDFLAGRLDPLVLWRADGSTSAPEHPSAPGTLEWLVETVGRLVGVSPREIDTERSLIASGLDSLSLVELRQALADAASVDIPLRDLATAHSLIALAERIRRSPSTDNQGEAPADRTTPNALSPGQRSLWFLQRVAPTGTAYNLSRAFRIQPPFEVEAMRRTMQWTVDRHAAFRTVFVEEDGSPRAHIDPGGRVAFQIVDAREWSEARLERQLEDEAVIPFDLAQGPLFRVICYQRNTEYVLLFAIHHIVVDFVSLEILVRDIGKRYRLEVRGAAEVGGVAAAPETAPETGSFDGPERSADWVYWREKVGGKLPLLDLPLDRPRPVVQRFTGATQPFRVGAATSRAIASLAFEHGVTMNATLLAAYFLLLHRYTWQSDLVVGVPASGRATPHRARAVGYDVNPVPIRADVSRNLTFVQLAERVRDTLFEALEHQVPFSALVERLQVPRNADRSPVFQSMFVMHGAADPAMAPLGPIALGLPGAAISLGELVLESRHVPERSALFDVTLRMAHDGAELVGTIEYNTDLFDASTIGRLARHWIALMDEVSRHPQCSIARLSPLPDDERATVLTAWNRTARAFDGGDLTLHDLVERQVARTPDAIAVVADDTQITWADLDRRATALARHLCARGVRPDTLVAICAERSIEMVVGLLGILKAGAAYVPVDPDYPADRIAFMLDDCDAPIVLTQAHLRAVLPLTAAEVVALDASLDDGVASDRAILPRVDATNLAYVIYTSGSTGRPKGAMNTHAGVVNRLLWMDAEYRLDASDRVLQKTPFSFDVSVWELFWPLITGARLVMATPRMHRDAQYIADVVERHAVTTLHFVPPMLAAFLEVDGLTRKCRSVRRIIASGEALSKAIVERCHARIDADVHNLYGPTEAAVDVTYWQCERQSAAAAVPIGRPIANLQMYVLDQELQPVPIGVTGDLYIGGVGVGRGYWRRPSTTAEAFVPHPYCGPGERLYRTGDRGRFTASGAIEYLGRLDHQVKVRGFRIETAEIELALARHPDVAVSVVVAATDTSGHTRLIAYVVPTADGAPDAASFRAHLGRTLPDYMTPSVFVTVSAMPLLPNGKVDRRALPALAATVVTAEQTPPRTKVEKALAAIWRDVLGCSVGMDDNFFALGGDSILTIRIATTARKHGLAIRPEEIFRFQTIRELAPMVDPATSHMQPVRRAYDDLLSVEQRAAIVERGGPIEDLYPCSPLQEGILLHSLATRPDDVYVVHVHCRMWGLDAARLADAWHTVVGRHPVLRTRFVWDGPGRPFQIVHPSAETPIEHLDWTAVVPDVLERHIAAHCGRRRAAGLDLQQAPVCRLDIACISDGSHVVIWTVHHIILDGWSFGIVLRDVLAAYDAVAKQRALPPSEAPTFRDYVDWLGSQDVAPAERFWKAVLAGSTRPVLVADRGAHRVARTNREQTRRISEEDAATLHRLGRERRLTMNSVAQGAWALALAAHARQRDVVFGATVSGRPAALAGIDDAVGMFINTLPVRVLVDPKRRTEDWLRDLQDRQAAATQFAYVSLTQIHAWSALPAAEPLFDTYLLFQNFPAEQRLRDERSQLCVSDVVKVGQSSFPLAIVVDTDPHLAVTLSFDDRLVEPHIAEALFARFLHYFSALATHADAPLSNILTDDVSRPAEHPIVIASTFVDGPLADVMTFWAGELGQAVPVQFAEYNQVFQQLLDPSSAFSMNRTGINVACVRLEDWSTTPQLGGVVAPGALEARAREFVAAVRSRPSGAPLLVVATPPSPALCADLERQREHARAEALICEVDALPGVHFVSSRRVDAIFPEVLCHDPHAEQLAHIPYTRPYYAALGTIVTRSIAATTASPFKVIVLDCDNTLWRGECGEIGPEAVVIEEGHRFLQRFMLAQHDAGVLLCLNSKNRAADVWAVFGRHPDMVLRRDHITAARINWESKADNLRALAAELGLAADSLIFVDDNPIEIAAVAAALPEVLTLQVPVTAKDIPAFLRSVWAFDRMKTTADDRQRVQRYRQEHARKVAQMESESLTAFIASLDLQVEIAPLGPEAAERAAQLTERTNQMNINGRKRSATDLLSLAKEGRTCLTVDVSDRFGRYGMVGLMVYALEGSALIVDTFLLSCRVLGRGVEHRMLRHLGDMAVAFDVGELRVEYRRSPRNGPARAFFDGVATRGRTSAGESPMVISVAAATAVEYRPELAAQHADDADGEIPVATATRDPFVERADQLRRTVHLRGPCSDGVEILAWVDASATTDARVTTTPYVEPRTAVEETLAAIWCETLRLDRVGVHDDLFALGGHSLLAVQILRAVRDRLQVELPLSTVFTSPVTIEVLAGRIADARLAALGDGEAAALLDAVEALSDEEVLALLDERLDTAAPSGSAPPTGDQVHTLRRFD